MKRVIYKKTGVVNKDTKSFPAILFRSRERKRNLLIGNSPVEVSDREYEALKKSKHSADIVAVTKSTKLPEPMEVIKGEPIKKVEKKTFAKKKKGDRK